MNTAIRPAARQSAPPDAVCADAVDLARAAAVELGGADVGDHLSVLADDERVATHEFSCTNAGYRGWVWSVTVARAPRSKVVTVDEVVLLPSDGAVLSPEWLPWDQRLRAGDLGVGDLLPTRADDPRLVPSWSAGDDDLDFAQDLSEPDESTSLLRDIGLEIGLGRVRVLSQYGRLDAADRWYAGEAGPDSPMAKAAAAHCGTCGFYLPLAGSLRLAFGVCANLITPDDGRVVSADHGCGAHSEAAEVPPLMAEPPPVLLDTVGFDVIEVEREPAAAVVQEDLAAELVIEEPADEPEADEPETADPA
ncbi:DUF3027 domain-containing protein [Acidothermaceae bacterium B102]|nr:DUF3027 domain-containing protein [Acidothermaceae bacterium B102]